MMTITVKLRGKDAQKALAELLSNVQYDKLDVRVSVKIEKGN